MASVTERKTYPRIPAKAWWQLREKAIQSPPKSVTAGYLQTVLGIGEGAAKNIIPALRTVGLIAENGEPRSLMNEWRDDELYSRACRTILENVYPEELRAACAPPSPDRPAVERWFARETNTGQAAAKQMAAFYALICEADPSAGNGNKQSTATTTRAASKSSARRNQRESRRADDSRLPKRRSSSSAYQGPKAPSVHIDVQIHISPEASGEQIDQIFASMAKHLYRA